MAAFDTTPFPLVEMQAAANAQNEWLALSVRLSCGPGLDQAAALHAVFGPPDLLTAIAPLDCILHLASPAVLTPALLALMPPHRVIFAIDAGALGAEAALKHVLALHDQGYRVLVDGQPADGVKLPPALRAVALDCSAGLPVVRGGKYQVLALFGPHLAHGVHSAARFADCAEAGFEWLSGEWPLHPAPNVKPHDGTSRKRLLALLGLLARDAESRELEQLLKQDPALSYHLLKLVNSAAFALSTQITSFGQAINLLGRRQLQRWLQLLLYARQQPDGMANPLLPLAALRAAQLECLCKLQGGARDEQDIAFMTGVFSLLDVLFGMSMEDIVGALGLAPAAAEALLLREGRLGEQLSMVEQRLPGPAQLAALGISKQQWWQSQLHAFHWAIQVGRNL
ncbi:HDOD domain-containing protein [Massilia sp. P8910]|uniref:HDOD domain-containing protein n=1 Tax=Massilia antarctica TaxID=2765360 RepID=UPI001E50103E|nr:HDOD domain-containing protein [Massilia antarctica]MCE3606577.1 HDOD domain-containing protein [Massilia antarctica]